MALLKFVKMSFFTRPTLSAQPVLVWSLANVELDTRTHTHSSRASLANASAAITTTAIAIIASAKL